MPDDPITIALQALVKAKTPQSFPTSTLGPDPFAAAVMQAKQQYPRFAKLPLALTKGTGPMYSETYPPEEDENPVPGKWTIQLRSPEALGDQKKWPDEVSLEAIHGLQATDPGYQKLTDEFVHSMTHDQLSDARRAYQRDMKNAGGNFMNTGQPEPFDSWMKRVQAQEYIRGGIFTKVIPNWIGPKGEGRYTPAQMKLLDKIKNYLQTSAQ